MLKLYQPTPIDVATQLVLDNVAAIDRSKHWERKTNAVKNFKMLVSEYGMITQDNRCIWCTLKIGSEGRRTAHRDHIAPKKLYPQWTFHSANIVLACEYCNGFSVKVDLDTINIPNPIYHMIDFHIVHPYYDNPSVHLTFLEENNCGSVVIQGLSAKGTWTILNMKLDAPGLTQERAKDLVFARTFNKLPEHFKLLLTQATAG